MLLSPGVSPPLKLPIAAENPPVWCCVLETAGAGFVSCTTQGANVPVSKPPFTNGLVIQGGVGVIVGVKVAVRVLVKVGRVPVGVGVRVPHTFVYSTTSSIHHPVAATLLSVPSLKRTITSCPAYAPKLTSTWVQVDWLIVQACLPDRGFIKAVDMVPLYPPTAIVGVSQVVPA